LWLCFGEKVTSGEDLNKSNHRIKIGKNMENVVGKLNRFYEVK
jgi:hypothetical protein